MRWLFNIGFGFTPNDLYNSTQLSRSAYFLWRLKNLEADVSSQLNIFLQFVATLCIIIWAYNLFPTFCLFLGPWVGLIEARKSRKNNGIIKDYSKYLFYLMITWHVLILHNIIQLQFIIKIPTGNNCWWWFPVLEQ